MKHSHEHEHPKAHPVVDGDFSKPKADGIPTWGKLVALVALLGAAAGVSGIFTDVGGDDGIRPDADVTIGLPTVNGMWITYTPTPTVAAAAGVPERGVGVPIIVRDVTSPAAAPIVAVVTVVVERVPLGLFPTPVPTLRVEPEPRIVVATPTPCWPPGQCVRKR